MKRYIYKTELGEFIIEADGYEIKKYHYGALGNRPTISFYIANGLFKTAKTPIFQMPLKYTDTIYAEKHLLKKTIFETTTTEKI